MVMVELQIELHIGMEVKKRMEQLIEIPDNALGFSFNAGTNAEDYYSCGMAWDAEL